MSDPLAEWTILVFLNGDNNLEPYALSDFREMARVGSTDRVNIVTQFDRNGTSTISGIPLWSQCLRFRVEQGMEPIPQNALEDLGEMNMGDGAVLADFVRWGMERFPAKRYMLDIWDHGQGWRLAEAMPVRGTADELIAHRRFRREAVAAECEEVARLRNEDGGDEPSRAKSRDVGTLSSGRVIESSYRYISTDDTNNDKLFNREIQDALTGALGGRQLDVIGFDACLMAMVETAFAMRGVARVMVGSEELEPGDGWNYSDWLQQLVTYPTTDAAGLGAMLVDAYERTYDGVDSDVTLSALELGRMEQLASLIDRLTTALNARLGTELANIRNARRACAVYAPGYGLHGIDLARFCDQLVASAQSNDLRNAAQAVAVEVRASVIKNYAGPGRQGKFGSHGLAIYFPETRALFNTDPDRQGYLQGNAHFPVEFVQQHDWDEFLQAYYQLVP